MIEIISKLLLLHLVGYLYYWQMGFNSVFKGLSVHGLKDECESVWTQTARQAGWVYITLFYVL